MSMQMQRSISFLFSGDGTSLTATFTVSDICLYNQANIAPVGDLTPLDTVVNANWNNNGTVTPIEASLNSKGTSVTFTFPTAPPAPSSPGVNLQEIIIVVGRLSS